MSPCISCGGRCIAGDVIVSSCLFFAFVLTGIDLLLGTSNCSGGPDLLLT